MEFVFAALILGLAGSLHCIGMCGPLVMAVHSVKIDGQWWTRKLIYHVGRLSVYAAMGAISGSIGTAFEAFGFQRWLSLVAGFMMLLFMAWPLGFNKFKTGPLSLISLIKSKFSTLISKKSLMSHFTLGIVNGLLPCGLVYVALSASLALGHVGKSAMFMAIFGLGTTPALFATGTIMQWLTQKLRVKSYRTIQISLMVISMLLIIRGANLGIPYLSPAMSAKTHKVDCCHKPY